MNRAIGIGLLATLLTANAWAQEPVAVSLKKQGDDLLKAGSPAKAEEAYRSAIKLDPSYQAAYSALSAHYLRTKQLDKAVPLLQRACKRFPTYAEGWYNLAYALRKGNELDAAIRAYRRFAQLRPKSPDPHYGIGLALKSKGDAKGAAASLRRYAKLETNPTKRTWVQRALKMAKALEAKTGKARPSVVSKPASDHTQPPAVSSHTPPPPPPPPKVVTPQRKRARRWKQKGDQLAQAGRRGEAVPYYRKAIAEDYSYTAAYNELGNALFGLKRYSAAIKTFRIAIRDNPSYRLGWYNLAYALRKSNKLLQAIAAYNKFITLSPREADPYFGLALAYKAQGNKVEAIKAFRKYIQLERRRSQERWVHKAKVEIAEAEGRPPPKYMPGKELVAVTAAPAPPKVTKKLSKRERRKLEREAKKRKAAEERRRRLEERRARLEARRLAQLERRKALQEKRREAAEERRRKLEERKRKREEARQAKKRKREEARQARLAAIEERKRKGAERKRKREEARQARLAAVEERKRARRARLSGSAAKAVPSAPPAAPAPSAGALVGVEPAADVIVSPPVPPPPGPPPESGPGRIRAQADTLVRAGKFLPAAKRYVQVVRLDPFDTKAYNGLAYAAFKAGAFRQGARKLSIGLRDNPSYVQGWLHQARLFRGAKDNVKAVGSYRKYLKKRPQDVGARLELARTLKGLGLKDQAVEEFRAASRPKRLEGNKPVVVAARMELKALGIAPGLVAPRAAVPAPKKTPAQLRSEARKRRIEERKSKAEEARQRRLEERKRRLEAKKAQLEARRLARIERRRALQEKRRKAAEERRRRLEERKRKREQARLQRLEARRARKAGRRRGARTPAAALAESVTEDLSDRTKPPVMPRRRTHHVLTPAPDAAAGLVRVADQQFSKKRYTVALGIYLQAARLDPSSSEPLYKAGVAAVALGQMHRAEDLFAKVLQIDPGNGTAMVNLQMARAAASSSKPTKDYLGKASSEARSSLKAGRYALAERQLDKLLRLNISAELHLLRAEARLALRKPQAALNDGGRALALDPGKVEAFRAMGDAHRQLGHRHKAIYYYKLYLSRTVDAGATPTRREIEREVSALSQGG